MANKKIWSNSEILNRSYDENNLVIKTTPISNGQPIGPQNPMDVDGDQVFIKDLDIPRCDIGTFTGGTIEDLFDDLYTTLTDSSINNPKTIKIKLNRGYIFNGISISTSIGDFSNVKIYSLDTQDNQIALIDESLDNTKYTSRIYRFSVPTGNIPISLVGTSGFLIEFHTADPVSFSFFNASKWNTNLSIIQGQTPRGNYVDFQATNKGNFKVALDEFQGDAFGRLKTSLPFTVFDNTMVYGTKDLFWSNLANNGTSVQQRNLARALLSVDAGVGNYIVEQTKMRFKYQPGKALEVLITGLLIDETGVIKRIGLFDVDDGVTIDETPKNGIFFENNSGVWSWNIANNGVVTETATRDNWNVDKLDGNGTSGFNLDLSATQIWFVDLEWLGVGTVRSGFVIDGEIVVCHEFHHANNGFQNVYMALANLPVNYSLLSNGGAGTMSHICTTVVSGGGFNPIGVSRSVSTDVANTVANGATETLIGVRLLDDSFTATILPITLNVISTAKSDSRVSFCLNPTYTGTPTWTPLTNSTSEYSQDGFPITDRGIVLYETFISANSNSFNQELESSLRLGKALNGVKDELWIVVEALNANDTYYGNITYAELI